MNDVQLTLFTDNHVIVSTQEVTQVEEIEIHHVDPLGLENHQFPNQLRSLVFDTVIVLRIQMKQNLSRSRYIDFFKRRKDCSSPHYPSFRKICYRFFSRSKFRNWQYFGENNSSYRPDSRPSSKSATATRRFVNNLQLNSSEPLKLMTKITKNFSKTTDKIEVTMYITEMENAVTPKNLVS